MTLLVKSDFSRTYKRTKSFAIFADVASMSPMGAIPINDFRVSDGAPVEIRVTDDDGKKYVLKVAVIVAEVAKTGTNPFTKLPLFAVGAQLVIDVQREK